MERDRMRDFRANTGLAKDFSKKLKEKRYHINDIGTYNLLEKDL